MSAPICLNCRFCKSWPAPDLFQCQRGPVFAGAINPVTGRRASLRPIVFCSTEREPAPRWRQLLKLDDGRCGPEGRFFEPRPVLVAVMSPRAWVEGECIQDEGE